jgi:predicted MFS family arabinose efflux permease
MVGIVLATFSLSSVVIRPLLGRLTDAIGPRTILLLGVMILSVSGMGYLIPSLVAMLLVRVLHGVGWAAFNTGALASIAHLAPAHRRGEASGVYNLMPGIAQLAFPAMGILVSERLGLGAAFAISCGIALVGVIVIGTSPRLPPVARPASRTALLDRAWMLPMALEFLNSMCLILVIAFPPLFATHKGIDVEELALYYPLYGGTVVAVRLLASRFLDRLNRTVTTSSAALIGMLGLGLGALAESVPTLTLAACLYGVATAVISPSTMALAIDRARSGTAGAAMATYSLGIQFGLGAGAFLWGVLIDAFGFPSPYLGAMVVMALFLALSLASGRGRPKPEPAPDPQR